MERNPKRLEMENGLASSADLQVREGRFQIGHEKHADLEVRATCQAAASRRGRAGDRKLLSDIARVAFVVLFVAAAAYVLHLPAVRQYFDVQMLRQRIQSQPWSGRLGFVALSTLLTGIGIPRLWISAAAGGVFGAFAGSVLAHLASMLGATLNFYGARLLLRGPVRRRMPARMRIWYQRFNENGFRWLLYMRLFPLSNATLTNVVGGVSQMRYRHFFAATFVGYLPLTIIFALFGSSAAKHSHLQLVAGSILLAVLLLSRALWRKRQTDALPETDYLDRAGSSSS